VDVYKERFNAKFGFVPKVEAIHAGLECGVFADAIKDFDCISVGPKAFDIHTVNERLSISSTAQMYELLLEILGECK
jgi:dipeptidase D